LKEFSHNRQVSRDLNLKRFESGLGQVGQIKPTNIVIDAAQEKSWHDSQVSGRNWRVLRLYWYGNDAQ
jgi:hypothetical protein